MSAAPIKWVGILLFGALAACGGGGGGGSSTPTTPAPVPTYSVSATVNGLNGTGLALVNNGGAPIPVAANGTVTISSAATSGATYNVTVQTQPTASPAQACRVVAGTGTVAASNVSGIVVECRPLIGKFVYVAARGGGNLAAALQINGYAIDAATGRLSVLPGSPVTPPTPGLFGSPLFTLDTLAIVTTPDQRYMVAHRARLGQGVGAVSGDTGGVLTNYRIDAVTGQLTEVSSLALAQGRRAFSSPTMHPNGRYLAMLSAPVDNAGAYSGAPSLSLVDVDPVTGALSVVPGASSIALPAFSAGQFGPLAVPQMSGAPTFNPTGSALYATMTFGRRSVALATFTQGTAGGAPYVADGWQAVQGPEPGSATATEFQSTTILVVSPNGRRLAAAAGYYSTDTGGVLGNITSLPGTLASMNLDATTGAVTSRTAPDVSCANCWPLGLLFSADSQSVYVLNPGFRTGFPRDQQSPGAFNAGPASFYPYSLDSNGVPSLPAGAPFAIGQNGSSFFVRVHPFTSRAYVPIIGTGQGGGIVVMQQGTGGAWSPVGSMATPGAAASIYAIEIDSSGRYLMATDIGQNLVHAYSIDQTSGQLAFLNSVPSQSGPGQILFVGAQMMP